MTLIVKSHADTVRYLEGLRHLTQTLATLCSPVAGKDSGECLEVERCFENVLDDGQRLCTCPRVDTTPDKLSFDPRITEIY